MDNSVNVNVSVTNLTQMDRHQADSHRAPVIHQEQNAQMTQNAAGMRLAMPVEPDALEKKNVDPDDKKRQEHKRQKGKRPPDGEKRSLGKTPVTGPFSVDVQA
jgi:hypothetical protein